MFFSHWLYGNTAPFFSLRPSWCLPSLHALSSLLVTERLLRHSWSKLVYIREKGRICFYVMFLVCWWFCVFIFYVSHLYSVQAWS